MGVTPGPLAATASLARQPAGTADGLPKDAEIVTAAERLDIEIF